MERTTFAAKTQSRVVKDHKNAANDWRGRGNALRRLLTNSFDAIVVINNERPIMTDNAAAGALSSVGPRFSGAEWQMRDSWTGGETGSSSGVAIGQIIDRDRNDRLDPRAFGGATNLNFSAQALDAFAHPSQSNSRGTTELESR